MLNIGQWFDHLITLIILGNYIQPPEWAECWIMPKSQYRMDYCQEKIQVEKFFIHNELIFSSDNYFQHYVYFRIFNTTNGVLSRQFEMPNFWKEDNSIKLIWAFVFDPNLNDDKCFKKFVSNLLLTNIKNYNSRMNEFTLMNFFVPNDYCQRLRKLSGTIVARLSNQQLYFMKYQNGNFIQQDDKTNHFIEFKALIKHFNLFGSVKSVTFEEKENLYITTHHDRYNQICITKIIQNNSNLVIFISNNSHSFCIL